MANTERLSYRIEKYEAGIPFGAKDFLDYGNYDAIRKQLIRMAEQGKIIRIIDGIYCKPEYSRLTEEILPVDVEKVAEYLSKRYGWQIVPSTELALNYLGLSTQVPAKYEYLSSGPYRDFTIQNNKLLFKHTANKNLFNLSPESALLLQTINGLGKRISDDDYVQVCRFFTRQQLETALKESANNKLWIHETIQRLLELKND